MEMEDNDDRKGSPSAGEGEGFASVDAAEAETAPDSVDQVNNFNPMIQISRI